jgi:hypothetical protein
MEKQNLTSLQEKFSQLVAEGNTYADAYRQAYDVKPETKLETIWEKSSRLMSEYKVSTRVKELQELTLKRNQVTLDEVINEMSRWLRFDPLDLMDENDCVKNLKDIPIEARKCISEIQVVEIFSGNGESRAKVGELKKVKFIDKRAVSDSFLKKFGVFINRKVFEVEDLNHIKELLDSIKD